MEISKDNYIYFRQNKAVRNFILNNKFIFEHLNINELLQYQPSDKDFEESLVFQRHQASKLFIKLPITLFIEAIN